MAATKESLGEGAVVRRAISGALRRAGRLTWSLRQLAASLGTPRELTEEQKDKLRRELDEVGNPFEAPLTPHGLSILEVAAYAHDNKALPDGLPQPEMYDSVYSLFRGAELTEDQRRDVLDRVFEVAPEVALGSQEAELIAEIDSATEETAGGRAGKAEASS